MLNRRLFALSASVLLALGGCEIKDPSVAERGQKTMPPLSTGRHIDPSLQESSVGVGHMPVNVVLSPDGKYAITTGCGSREQLCANRVSDGKQMGKVEYRSTPQNKTNGLYYGLVFGPDGKIYA